MLTEAVNNFDEIVLPEIDSNDVVVIPLDKYEWMIKENAKVEMLFDYLIKSKKPSIAVIKSILRVPYNG